MLLIDIISGISGLTAMESWIKEKLSDKKRKDLENIAADFNADTLAHLKDEYTHEKIDTFIASHAAQNVNPDLFSPEARKEVIDDFFRRNSDLRFDYQEINEIVNKYLDLLEQHFKSEMTSGEKYLAHKIDIHEEKIVNQINKIHTSIENRNNSENAHFSEVIINSLNMIDSLILKNTGKKIWKNRSITDINYLKAKSLQDVFMRLRELFRQFDVSAFSDRYTKNYVEPLIQWIINLAPDLALNLSESFHYKGKPALACVYNYEEKNEEYYIAIGALGLFNNHSEDRIFECVMTNIANIFDLSCILLNTVFATREYEKIQLRVTDEMQSHLLRKIKFSTDKDLLASIKILLNEGPMLDTLLAKRCGNTILELRKGLYPATKTFLQYSYHDNSSTKVQIKQAYLKTFHDNYEKIFGGGFHESESS